MQSNIPLMDDMGQAVPFALSILRDGNGRYHVCRISQTGPTGAPADISSEALHGLATLSYGQTCWLPNHDEAILRITGRGALVEVCENKASAEPLFLNLTDLQTVLEK